MMDTSLPQRPYFDYMVALALGCSALVFLIPIVSHIGIQGSPFIFMAAGVLILMGYLALGFIAHLPSPSLSRLAKYIATGLTITCIDAGIFNMLLLLTGTYTGASLIIYNAISFGIAITISYLVNRVWTFNAKGMGVPREYFLYVGITIGSLVFNSVLIYALVIVVGPPFEIDLPLWINIVKALTIFVSFVWNYTGYTLFVFKRV
jgi:putative flippase GtrA